MKAGEALFLLGYFSLSSRKLCSLRSWLQTMCDSSVVRLLLPVLKMTHGNKQNELSAQGDLAGKHNLFSFFFSLQMRYF